MVSFTRSGLTIPWDTRFGSLLEFAEACEVPVGWSCRTGVCHTCGCALVGGAVDYDPDPLQMPSAGNVLICCGNLNGAHRTTSNRLIPYCMFTDPELVPVGLNESQAKCDGVAYRLAKLPMAAVLRTRTVSEPRGFTKMLSDPQSDRILGFTAFGVEASELLAALQTAMLGNLSYTVLRDGIYTHPTIAEGLVFLLAKVPRPY